MEIRKERNILAAYENGVKVGGFNLSDGTWIGKSGKQVKRSPNCFTYDNLSDVDCWSNRDMNERLRARAIEMYRRYFDGANGEYEYTPARGQRLEALLSLGLYPNTVQDLDDTTKLTKEVVRFFKEDCKTTLYSASRYLHHVQRQKLAVLADEEGMPIWTQRFVDGLSGSDFDAPIDYYRSAIKRLDKEKAWDFFSQTCNTSDPLSYIYRAIVNYYHIAMKLFGSVKVERNFLVNLSEIYALKKKYDDEHYNEKLAKNNDLPALYYEDETFFIRPLLTRDEFHDEGEQQRNCVERMYMSRVHDGYTHVVQVRRKDNPKKALITCEVYLTGKIYQWLAFGNSHPSSEYSALKNAYEAHLRENFKKK